MFQRTENFKQIQAQNSDNRRNIEINFVNSRLHKKGILDDPFISFTAYWNIANRISVGISSAHPLDTSEWPAATFPTSASFAFVSLFSLLSSFFFFEAFCFFLFETFSFFFVFLFPKKSLRVIV